jgi:hypothetical protein
MLRGYLKSLMETVRKSLVNKIIFYHMGGILGYYTLYWDVRALNWF